MHKIILALGLLAILVFGWLSPVGAQQEDGDWRVPTNISFSGSATSPRTVTDANRIVHALWPDAALGSFRYVFGVPGNWSAPSSVELPFGTRQYSGELDAEDATPLYVPTLMTDSADRLHALWREDDDALYYSQVLVAQLSNFGAWSIRQQVAPQSVSVTAATETNGRVHLAYIRSQGGEGAPAGIYYSRLDGPETGWSEPSLLYQSDYYQQLLPEDANIALAVAETDLGSTVYVAWDNRSLEKIFLSRSLDRGRSWENPVVVDQRRPEDGPTSVGPSNVRIVADGNEALLTWQAGHDLNQCAQFYRWSTDRGATWQGPQNLYSDFSGCPEKVDFLGVVGNFRLLFTIILGQPTLMAWDGTRWSDPQSQPTLTSFTSPETFRQVGLGCRNFIVRPPVQLVVIGCGTSPGEGSTDIWQIARSLDSIEEWFPSQTSWTQPAPLTTGDFEVTAPNLVSDSQGVMHAMWVQSSSPAGQSMTIHYARRGQDAWTSPVTVLSSPDGVANRPAIMVGADDILRAVWIGGDGNLYFSSAASDQAIFSTDWTSPAVLASPQPLVSHAAVAPGGAHAIYAAYTVPLNELRGVYMIRSENDGRIWSEPNTVADGAVAGWEIVGPLQMAVGNNGDLHLLLDTGDLDPELQNLTSQTLYYVRSSNDGDTITEPENVVDAPAISWSKILLSNQQIVHRFWQEQQENASQVQHEYSVDGGRTWSDPTRVTNDPGPVDVIVAGEGQLVLVQINDRSLTVYTWDGASWDQQAGLTSSRPGGVISGEPQELALAFTPPDTLGVIAASRLDEPSTNLATFGLFASTGKVDLPVIAGLGQLPVQTPISATPVPTPTATLALAPTETPSPIIQEIPGADSGSGLARFFNSEVNRLVLAILPVGGVIIVIILYRRVRMMRD